MQLSGHFSLRELTQSQTALRKGIDNKPTQDHIENLTELAVQILEPTRRHFGKPIAISSGYRSEELCEAIGSKTTSQHAKGEAADFECFGVDNKELAKYIKNNLIFDQLILEYYPQPNSWIHVSFVEGNENRKESLTKDKEGYKVWQ